MPSWKKINIIIIIVNVYLLHSQSFWLCINSLDVVQMIVSLGGVINPLALNLLHLYIPYITISRVLNKTINRVLKNPHHSSKRVGDIDPGVVVCAGVR